MENEIIIKSVKNDCDIEGHMIKHMLRNRDSIIMVLDNNTCFKLETHVDYDDFSELNIDRDFKGVEKYSEEALELNLITEEEYDVWQNERFREYRLSLVKNKISMFVNEITYCIDTLKADDPNKKQLIYDLDNMLDIVNHINNE